MLSNHTGEVPHGPKQTLKRRQVSHKHHWHRLFINEHIWNMPAAHFLMALTAVIAAAALNAEPKADATPAEDHTHWS